MSVQNLTAIHPTLVKLCQSGQKCWNNNNRLISSLREPKLLAWKTTTTTTTLNRPKVHNISKRFFRISISKILISKRVNMRKDTSAHFEKTPKNVLKPHYFMIIYCTLYSDILNKPVTTIWSHLSKPQNSTCSPQHRGGTGHVIKNQQWHLLLPETAFICSRNPAFPISTSRRVHVFQQLSVDRTG